MHKSFVHEARVGYPMKASSNQSQLIVRGLYAGKLGDSEVMVGNSGPNVQMA